MPKPFDAASKHLIEIRPRDWLTLAGFPVSNSVADISIVDADLSNVMTTAADKLIRVENPPGGGGGYLAHVEFQSSADSDLDRRIHTYNAVARRRHGMPVWSVVFLLRPQAFTSGVQGRVMNRLNDLSWLDFGYHLIKVWELPTTVILNGGLGTLPLAPITSVEVAHLPPVIQQVRTRLSVELPDQEGKEYLLAMQVLMGLKYEEQITESLMQSIAEMEDSVEWQKIFRRGMNRGKAEGKAEGVVEGERLLLIRLGTQQFGAPPDAVLQKLQSIQHADEISELGLKLLRVANWDELFAG